MWVKSVSAMLVMILQVLSGLEVLKSSFSCFVSKQADVTVSYTFCLLHHKMDWSGLFTMFGLATGTNSFSTGLRRIIYYD